MPQSATSSCGKQSGSSAFTRRYRTRALTSHVDETLFGTLKQHSAGDMKDDPEWGSVRSRSRSAPAPKEPKTETVRIITKDLIRDLRIPNEDPSGQSVILSSAEFRRIVLESHVTSLEEKAAVLESQRQAREEAMDAAEQRKAQMRQADLSRQKNQNLSELEAEARDRAQYLLERANTLRMEQEDEVKKLNELIQEVQCHVVRDVQIQEKKLNSAEWLEEEKRLDAMMEVERRRALETQEQIEQLRKQQRINGKMCILDQIQMCLEEKMLQDELKEQEGQQLLENMERMQMEELKAIERRKEEQRNLLQEIQKINEENLLAKEQKKEEERLADLRAVEYTRKKLEREAEYEAEQIRIKKDKEKEVARLRALQERDRDHKAEQDEIRARRNQEAAGREWRRKEKEQTLRKLEVEEKLKATRLEQVTHKEHLLSIEAGRERAEFERVLRAQQELIEKERERERQRHQQIQRHAEAVRQQVREREMQAITQRRELFREGERLEEEARNRRARLDEIKEKKLMELKAAGLSDKYYKDVERKVRALPAV
ncbi:cilia- and flagella-associated protein 45 [Carassius auratus]|uniref:Cilia- and flagella-associated protein 45 n=1 Tax=Carassius auratus TaxID=7957 RepID=A0A6P6LQP8_CARAU|nr:cilia- and flagella-associated protein 45 [Carassius auratus]XP_052387169.1 cilia- and flagella-associated protein 45 [Carassius gibelio]